MALVEMLMPKMGESVMEGTVLNWLKAVGDEIEMDEPVLEVATDKVDTEIPAPYAGVLEEILVEEGDVVAVGSPIAKVRTEGGEGSQASNQTEEKSSEEQPVLEESISSIEKGMESAQSYSNAPAISNAESNRFYSPLVMSIAKTEQISAEELASIAGTGMDQRVTKQDILAYVDAKKSGTAKAPVSTEPKVESKVQEKSPSVSPSLVSSPASSSLNGNTEIIEMDRMRKMIAQRMLESKQISPHVTTFVEVDVTNVVLWRNKVKKEFEAREGEKLTYTPIFLEAIAKTLRDYPMVNISVEGDKIIRKKDINLGMAAALPSGNLIVPVIAGADQLNLVGMAKKVNDLARRARENKLKPDELSGGTYSVSNIGSFGNEMGTPIIMQPQVAIMAIGAIKKKPAVIETPTGDVIAIRHMMFISHSYDHRVVDGALGGMFARTFADYLENFDLNRSI